jgi:starch-binding outer membrane protein, SusD/RagB family
MKRKLNIVIITLALVNLFAFTSCVDILEKPTGSEITSDTIFSNRLYATSFLTRVYYSLVPRGFPYTNGNPSVTQYSSEFARSILASISDEGCNTRGATWGWYVNTAGFDPYSSAKNQEDGFGFNWKGIREAYIFIENIDKVPDNEISSDEKKAMKAEAKLLIAIRYQEMLKRYAGIPIIKGSFNSQSDSLLVPRSTVKEVVDFIVSLCDETAKILPDTYSSDKRGRVTKGVALANKSRVLLYAASPFFNCAEGNMVLSYAYPKYVCYGNYDKERWLIAAQAANDVLAWAKTTGGVALITDADIGSGKPDRKNSAYGYATSVKDNKEIILTNKGYSSSNNGFADGIYWIFTSRGLSVMQSIIYNFRKADGTDQTWPTVLKEKHPFTEYTSKVNEMESRFYQCCWPVGQAAPNFSASGSYTTWPYSSIDDMMGSSDMYGACPMVKFHYNYSSSTLMQDWIVFRLAEFYLNYAEAVNEYYGPAGKLTGADYTAVEAVNVIRRRGGLRDLLPEEYANQDIFRKQIQRERAVELFAEGHRNFDCRRWKIADEIFGERLHTLRYVQNSTKKGYDYYYLDLHDIRVWSKAMYLYPFPQEEVNKGYLIQNPGY